MILQTDVFLKDIVIAFDFVKKKNLYDILLPNTERGGHLVVFLLSSPNFLLDLRHVLYFGRKQRETTQNLLPEWCPPLTNNIPSLFLNGPKIIGSLNFG